MIYQHPERKDFTIHTGKETRLPNTSHIGYDKAKAKRGDLIVWNTSASGFTEDLAGIVLGTIERKKEKYLLTAVFSKDMGHIYQRWVAPEWVSRCRGNGIECVPAWASDPDFWALDPVTMIYLITYGVVNRNSFSYWKVVHEIRDYQLQIGEVCKKVRQYGDHAQNAVNDGYDKAAGRFAKQAVSLFHEVERLEEKKLEANARYHEATQQKLHSKRY